MPLERFPLFLLSRLTVLTQQKGYFWWLSGLIWLATIAVANGIMSSPASASVELRVAVEDGVSSVAVGSSTQAVVRDSSGRTLGEIAPMNAFIAKPARGGVSLDHWQSRQIWVEPAAGGYVFIGDRWYRGRTQVVPAKQGLTAVNYVDLEQYLYSVLGGEMNGNWPQEALKAQAVAARSYALYQRQRAASRLFDVGDTPAWQVYGGIKDESTGTQAAVNATAGQVLVYNGQIIEAVFHSSAGGCTENVEDVWSQALPYLRSVKETFTEVSPVAQWEQDFSQTALSKRIPGVGMVRSLQPVKLTPCGRVLSMRVEGSTGQRIVSGDAMRSALNLKSTLFTITPQVPLEASKNKAQAAPMMFAVAGRGFGHGLGMSQWGAYNLALNNNATYQQILMFYYQNTQLAKIEVQ